MNKVRAGYKMTELGEIPNEWKIKKLGEIAIGKGEYGIGASASEYVEGKPRYLRITDIGDGCKLLFNDIKGLDEKEYEKYILKEGDIVFARTGNTTGKGYVYNKEHGELVYAGFLIKYSVDNNIANHNFIKYVIQSKRYWDWVNIMSTRSGQPGINSNEYSSFIIQLPPLEEQEKIASILSTVDEQIDNVDALIEKNKELKKGLMQTLLTKGIGHTKFKKTEIGEIPEKWEVSKLGQLFYINTKSVEPSKLEEDILHYSLPAFDESRVPVKQSSIEIKSNKYLIEENSILVSKLNPRIKRIWLVNKVNFIKQICSTEFINYVAINKENVNLKYFEQYFNSDIFQQELLNRESGSTGSRKRVTPNSTMDIKIALPSSCEQEKIAIILSELDEKIEGYENKKQKLEELKKGLMQQLLTGNIRVI